MQTQSVGYEVCSHSGTDILWRCLDQWRHRWVGEVLNAVVGCRQGSLVCGLRSAWDRWCRGRCDTSDAETDIYIWLKPYQKQEQKYYLTWIATMYHILPSCNMACFHSLLFSYGVSDSHHRCQRSPAIPAKLQNSNLWTILIGLLADRHNLNSIYTRLMEMCFRIYRTV